MKRENLIIAIIAGILICIIASCSRPGNKNHVSSCEDDFRSVEQTIRNNLGWAKNKDFSLLESTIYLDSTYLVVNPTDRVAIGMDDFRANERFFASPDFEAVGFEISDLHINFSEDRTVAWFYCHLNDWNRWKGEPANWENTRWTGVLEKINGKWKIRQQHFSYPATR